MNYLIIFFLYEGPSTFISYSHRLEKNLQVLLLFMTSYTHKPIYRGTYLHQVI